MDKDTAQQQLKIINLKLQSKNLTDEDVSTLERIAKNIPQLTQEVWEISKKFISKESDYSNLHAFHTTSCFYGICCHIAERQHQLAPEVFETFRTRLHSDKNNYITICRAYTDLIDITHIPELRAEVFKTFRAAVKSNKNNMSTLDDACYRLKTAMDKHPSLELVSEIRTTAKTILQSDKLECRGNYHGEPKHKANDLLVSCRDYIADQKLLTFEEFFDDYKPYGIKKADDFVISEAKKVYETFKTPESIQEFFDTYSKTTTEQKKKCNLQYAEHSYHSFLTACSCAYTYAEHVQKHSKKSSQKQTPAKDSEGR